MLLKRAGFALAGAAIAAGADPLNPRGAAAAALGTGTLANALVVASNAPESVKAAAMQAKADYGNLVQVCSGTNDHFAINAAINALPPNGGRVLFSGGLFRLGGPVVVTRDGLILEGQGWTWNWNNPNSGTILQLADNANCNAIQNADTTQRTLTIMHLGLDGNRARNIRGHGIRWDYLLLKPFDLLIQNFPQSGIRVVSETGHERQVITGSHIYCLLNGEDGISDVADSGNPQKIQGPFLSMPNWFLGNGRNGMWLHGANSGGGSDGYIEAFVESNRNAGAILVDFNRSHVRVWAKGNGEGIVCAGLFQGSTVELIAYHNSAFRGPLQDVRLAYVTGGIFRLNISEAGPPIRDGLTFDSAGTGTFTDVDISGSIVSNQAAIRIRPGATFSNVVLHDARLAGATGIFTPARPAGFSVRDCIGYTTTSRGVATIASGATSTSVPHNLPEAPSIEAVRVTPINDLGAATKFWVSNVDATSLTISVDRAPAPGEARFVWEASLT